MSIIICPVQMFNQKQKVKILTDKNIYQDIGEFSIEELSETIPNLCHDSNINKVHLIGPENFCFGIKNKILINNNNYNYNKIEVEIN